MKMPYSKKSSAAARYSTGTDRAAQNSPARMTKKAAQKISSHANGTFRRTPYGDAYKPAFGGYDERYYRSIVTEQGDRLKVIDINQK